MARNPSAAAPPAKAAAETRPVGVVATRLGFYGGRRVRPGTAFTITLAKDQKLPTWVKPATPAKAAEPESESDGDGDAGGSTADPVI